MLRPALFAAVALCLGACGNDSAYGLFPDGGRGDGDPGVAQGAGLPCDVRSILADHCQTCHGATPSNGAPFSLMSYRDLTAKNPGGIEIAQRALIRMKSTTSPMPPTPGSPVPAADVAVFESWVSAGVAASATDCKGPPGPFDGPPVCTSGVTWPGGHGSAVMHPGLACIACHARSGDGDGIARGDDHPPHLIIAGTVFPTGHEPNDCDGATIGAVEVTDATGQVTTLPVNSAGNFLTTTAIPFPIHVALVANGKRRAMVSSPPVGDCNSCHTQSGANGAPGRITLP